MLSSHRRFISKIDVIELSDELCGKGMPMSLFLFTDSVEVSNTEKYFYINVLFQFIPVSLEVPYSWVCPFVYLNITLKST